LCKENFVWIFHANINFFVFFCGTMCVRIFFSEFSECNENIYEGFSY